MSQYRDGPPRIGSQPGTTSGRSCIEKLVVFRFPDRLNPSCTVNGCPDRSVVMLFSDQPFSTAPVRPERSWKNGSSQVPLNVTLCRASNADSPRSYCGSYQSRPYWTTLLKS